MRFLVVPYGIKTVLKILTGEQNPNKGIEILNHIRSIPFTFLQKVNFTTRQI